MRWRLISLAVVACLAVAGAVALRFAVKDFWSGFTLGDPEGQGRQTTLARQIGGAKVEAVALRDVGPEGARWYLLLDPEAARDVPFTIWEDGFLVSLFRSGRCKDSEREVSVEPLKNGEVYKPLHSCAGPETDISALVALAKPAREVVASKMPLADREAMEIKVRADPGLFEAQMRRENLRYDYSCFYEFPYVWEVDGSDKPYLMTRYQEWVTAALLPVLGDESGFDLGIENGYRSSYVMYPAEGRETSEEGWPVGTSFAFVKRDQERRKVPGISLYRPKVVLNGTRADCEAFQRLDFTPVWQDDRDMAALEAAWAKGVAIDLGTGTQNDWRNMVGTRDFRRPGFQNLFEFRYFALQ